MLFFSCEGSFTINNELHHEKTCVALCNTKVATSCQATDTYDLHHEKTTFCICENKGADQLRITAKLISPFVFATWIVQFLYFLNPKFPVSSHVLFLYSSVSVGSVWKPHCLFSHDFAHISFFFSYTPQPLYNTIAGIQTNFHVCYPIRVIMSVKYIDI